MAKIMILILFLFCIPTVRADTGNYSVIPGMIGWKKTDSSFNKGIQEVEGGLCLVMAIWGYSQNTNYGFITGTFFTYKFGLHVVKASYGYK